MTRDEALDLLPLLAGGELDEVTAAAAQRAVEEDPTLMAELESYRALDAALATAYAPDGAAPPAHELALAEPQAPRPLARGVVVRRRCPYCHDAIEAEALVVCAACATPHHAPCFEAHEGCSLLGCGSSASIAASGPASVVCAGCARSTPQGAPFCAWCGADVEATAPRHARPRDEAPFDWRRHAAAAALLLASTFGAGSMFGLQQAAFLRGAQTNMENRDYVRAAQAIERLYETLLALQQAHLAERRRYASTIAELQTLRPARRPGPAQPVDVLLERLTAGLAQIQPYFEVSLRAAGDRHRIVIRDRDRSRAGCVVDERSVVWTVREPYDVDPASLELVGSAPIYSKTAVVPDWRTPWTPR